MAAERGNRKVTPQEPDDRSDQTENQDTAGRRPAIPELVRRALTLGLSGFFLTEEAVRKALGDTLPKDWTDFAADQSERTRKEFLERLSYEIAQSFEKIDLAAILEKLLEGRTLEVKAQIRLAAKERGRGSGKLDISVESTGGDT
jgi:hypothetical protein